MVSFDQLNNLNCASAKRIAGRPATIERAVKRGSHSAEFECLEAVLVSDFGQAGGARVQEFENYVADFQKGSDHLPTGTPSEEADKKRDKSKGGN